MSALAIGLLLHLRAESEQRYRSGLAGAQAALSDGRYATARRRLVELEADWPGRGAVLYHLGLCEKLLGRLETAEAAWARVPPDAPEAGWALVHRASLSQGRGRLSETEGLLRDALERGGSHRTAARWELVQLLRLQGRFDEARRLYQAGVDEPQDPVVALIRLYRLDNDPFPIESSGRSLEAAAALAPEDPAVQLGLAHLALRGGDLETASRRLDTCLARRPGDAAVWGVRLDWARARQDVRAALEALKHLPAPPEPAVAIADLRAWFAASTGDPRDEERALKALLEADPGRAGTLDRLAELAIAAGRSGEARAYRTRREDLERHRFAYEAELAAPDPRARADRLARLAAALGRRFDAACWSALARGERLRPGPAAEVAPAGPSLAALAPDLVRPGPAAPRAAEPAIVAHTWPRFEDDAAAAGLSFDHQTGQVPGRMALPETMAGGIALLDYNGDGWLDVYAVQGGSFPPAPGPDRPTDRLYRNRGDGTFEDVTAAAGLVPAAPAYGHGITVGDYDNDGDPDLFVARWRAYALYRNRGDGTFDDATATSGLAGDRDWPTSAAFADLDADGDLDLYVCHYLAWDEHTSPSCVDPRDPTKYDCVPLNFEARADHVFRNDDGQFVDVTAEAGIVDTDGRGLGVVAADLDDDGLLDLFVANDMTANRLYRNLGGFRFEEVAHTAGVAANSQGGFQAGMGVACGDLDGDGRVDLAVTNYYGESTSFFRNLGAGLFADHTAAVGLAVPTRYRLGFGIAALDVDNDARLDLLTANGHVHDGRPEYPWQMPAQLLVGTSSGRFADATAEAGPPLQALHLGRGLASGDLDNDGRVDALLLAQDEPLVYLHNRSDPAGRSVTLRLEGTRSNRDAIGAVVTVVVGARKQVLVRHGGGSYQSSGDPRLHVGLGSAERIDHVEVRWPSGRVDRFEGIAAGSGYVLREGASLAEPLSGFPRS